MELSQVLQALRNADAAGDKEAAQKLAQIAAQLSAQQAAPQQPPQQPPQSGAGAAFRAGIERLKGAAGAIGAGLGIEGGEAYARAQEEKAKSLFKPTEFKEAPLTYLGELAAGSVPFMAAPIVAGGAAALGGAPALGAAGAAGLASLAQFTGTNIQRQLEEGKTGAGIETGKAVAAAIPQAALDMVGFKMLPGIRQIFAAAGKDLTEEAAKAIAKQGTLNVLKDYGVAAAKSAGAEGVTEAGQQFLERLQAGLNITDEGARDEYWQSLMGGALLGGMISPAGRYVERGRAQAQQAAAEEAKDAEARKAKRAEQEAMRQSPEYAQQVFDDLQAAQQERESLKSQLRSITKGSETADQDRAFNRGLTQQIEKLQRETIRPLSEEVARTEPVRLKAQEAQAAEAEKARIAGLSPEEYAAEQAAAQPAMEPVKAKPVEGDPFAMKAPIDQVQVYAQERGELARQQMLTPPELGDYADYLMADPGMAAQMVKTRTKMPGLTQKQNDTLLGGLNLRLKEYQKLDMAQRQAQSEALQKRIEEQMAARGPEAEEAAALEESRRADEEIARQAGLPPGVGSEIMALHRMATRPAGTSTQFGMFEGKPEQYPSAAIGQMKQQALGEDVTYTAEEPPQRGQARRVPGPEFQLRPGAGGMETATREMLADRLHRVLSTYDLSPEAVAFLQRVEQSLPQRMYPGYAMALDEQLRRIESGEEGVPRKGAGRPAMLQAFPAAGARAETAAPTEAFKYQTETMREAVPGQATTKGRRVVQPEGERVAVEAGETPVEKRVPGITPETLRGPSAAPVPLSLATEMETGLRTAEQAAAENAGQMGLFPAEEKKLGTIKESPEALRRVQEAPTARAARKKAREAAEEKKPQTAAEKARAEQGVKDAKLLEYKRDLSAARTKYWNEVREAIKALEAKLPGHKVRAISELERDAREKGLDAEAAQSMQYKNALYNKDVGWLSREIGKVEQRLRELTAQVKAAKKKSASYIGGDTDLVQAFKGQGNAIREQARLAVRLQDLNDAYDLRKAAAAPRVTEATRVKEKERVRPEERDEVEAEVERAQLYGTRKDRLANLQKQRDAAEKAGKAVAVRKISEQIVKAEAELAEVAPKKIEGKVTQATRKESSAPGKMRTGTPESKKTAGVSKRPVIEGRTEKLPTAKEAVAAGNVAALLKQAAAKPKTVAEIKAMTMEQDRVVVEAQQKLVDDLRIQKVKLSEEVTALEALQKKGETKGTAATLEAKRKDLESVTRAYDRSSRNLKVYHNATVAGSAVSEVSGTEMRGAETRTMKLFGDDGDIVYRVAETKGPGLHRDAIARLVTRLTEGWKNVPTIILAEDVDALPEHIREQAKRDEVEAFVPGVYDTTTGNVYLVASNLHSAEDVFATVAHEVAGHFGLRSMLGEDYKATMGRIFEGNQDVREKAKAKMAEMPSLSQQVATEEVLADMAEQNPDKPTSALRQLYNALKQWFRKTFNLDAVSDKAVQQIVADARRHVIEGTKAAPAAEAKGEALYRAKKPAYANDELRAVGNVADRLIDKQRSLTDTVKQEGLGMGLMTRLVDNFAPLEAASKLMDSLKGTQMMYYARMFNQKMHFLAQAVGNGAISLNEHTRKDGRKEWLIESEKGASLRTVVETLKKAGPIAGSPDAAAHLFSLYTVAKRAERVGLDKLNFGGVVTQDELNEAMQAIKDNGLAEIFEDARQEYNEYNKGMMQFAVDTGAISKEAAALMTKAEDYVPYYRARDGVVTMMLGSEEIARIGNLKQQPYLKELVGGEERVLDFMTSAVQNSNMLVDMALRNLATKSAAFELEEIGLAKISEGVSSGSDVVNFKKDGKDFHAVIETDAKGIDADLLVKGMEGIPYQTTWLTKGMGIPARVLRKAVTLSPVYAAKQLFRDSLAAPILSGANFTPIMGALKEVGSVAGKKLERRGVTGGQTFTGTQEDLTTVLRQINAGESGWMKGLAKLEAMSMEADALTRRAQYNSYIQQGLSEMEATYAALESMNFSKRGASPAMHFLSTVIPFFNAQVQSLNVLYKAFTGDMPFNEKLKVREKLLARGAVLASATIAYAVLMQDDETYKNATPEQKYGNWFIHVPGFDEAVRLPIPFEIGYLFKALPEALVNTMANEEGGQDALKALRQIVMQTIPGGSSYMIPQAMKPLIEVGLGKSFYTGRDLESAYEQSLAPGKRTRETTSDFARVVGDMFGMSPIKLDHLVQGYLSGTGLAMVQALNFAIPTPASPERATLRTSELPVIGSLFQPKDAGGIINAAYERMNEAKQVKTTFDDMVKRGRVEEAKEYLHDNMEAFADSALATNFVKVMRDLTEAERVVRASNLTPADKRQKLDELKQAKIRVAQAAREAGKTKPQ